MSKEIKYWKEYIAYQDANGHKLSYEQWLELKIKELEEEMTEHIKTHNCSEN